MNRFVLALLAVLLLGTPGRSGSRVDTIRDVSMIENGDGECRYLFKIDGLEAREGVAIVRATLTFEATSPVGDRQGLPIGVYPVTTNWAPGTVSWDSGWTRPGGDFDLSLISLGELPTSSRQVRVDLTGSVREIVESGSVAYGFVVNIRDTDQEGIPSADAGRLGGLSSATLEVESRAVPPRRSRL